MKVQIFFKKLASYHSHKKMKKREKGLSRAEDL